MNKNSQNAGAISRHLAEMMSLTSSSPKRIEKQLQEAALKPPKPLSPPKLFSAPDPGMIVSQEPLPLAIPSVFSVLSSEHLKLSSVQISESDIKDFIEGGSRVKWLNSLQILSKQSAIPLIKEIIYNNEKIIQAKQEFKKMLKDYLFERNLEKMNNKEKPPFLSTSKTPLDGSKHRVCIKAKVTSLNKNSRLEEMRCNVLMQIKSVNNEILRTVFLTFHLRIHLNSIKREYVETGILKREESLLGNILKKWKEYTTRKVEKNEFNRLLKNSMSSWRMSRVFLAFRDLTTYKERNKIRVKRYSTILWFHKAKRILFTWKALILIKKANHIEKNISACYYNSQLLLRCFYSFKSPKDFKGETLGRSIIAAKAKSNLKAWYFHHRILEKHQREFSMFLENRPLIIQLLKPLTKPLGDHRGLLETSKKSLYITTTLPASTNTTLDLSQKLHATSFKPFPKGNINMFTLSVSNLKSADNPQDLLPENFSFGQPTKLDRASLKILIQQLFEYLKRLNSIPEGFHLKKSWTLTQDCRGSNEKIAEMQYSFKIASFFYQNWKKRFSKQWLKKLLLKFHLIKVCKKFFVAQKAWKKFKSSQDDSETQRIKCKMADNFYWSRKKISSFFTWNKNANRLKSLRLFEFILKKFFLQNSFAFWRHLSKKHKKTQHQGFFERKVKRRVIERWHKLITERKKVKFGKIVVEELNTKKPKQKTTKKKAEKKSAENKKIVKNIKLAEKYHRVLMMKKTMCGFIHALKISYKKLKSSKFFKIKQTLQKRKIFDGILSYSLLSKRKSFTTQFSKEFYETKLKTAAFKRIKTFTFRKSMANYKSFKAYDHYLNKLQQKCNIFLQTVPKSNPILLLSFMSWKKQVSVLKSNTQAILLAIKSPLLKKALKTWKNYNGKISKSLTTIFRDLQVSLKSSFKSLSSEKKVRFNL